MIRLHVVMVAAASYVSYTLFSVIGNCQIPENHMTNSEKQVWHIFTDIAPSLPIVTQCLKTTREILHSSLALGVLF